MPFDPTPPERRGETPLADGRVLAWSEWGPTEGAPVLFSPGAGTSSSLGFAPHALAPLGVRLIAIDRPGLGRSTPRPDRELLDFAADVAALARARGLDAPAIVGFSQGAPFALACAAAGVVAAAAIVAGSDELGSPALRGALAPGLGEVVDLAARDPAAAATTFAAMTPETMRAMILASSHDVDLAVYQAPAFAAAFARALDEGFAQGPDGYARDTVLAMRPWTFDVAAIRCPVRLWYGLHDTSPVHSPDLGATLARRIPGATRTVLPGAGGALLWTHGAHVLAALVATRAATRGP